METMIFDVYCVTEGCENSAAPIRVEVPTMAGNELATHSFWCGACGTDVTDLAKQIGK